jgi:hypothetical protein
MQLRQRADFASEGKAETAATSNSSGVRHAQKRHSVSIQTGKE